MPQYRGTERRRFVRIPFWFITRYRIYPYNSSVSPAQFKQGIGKNISVGGICFEAEDRFDSNTLLEIELDMPALDHAVKILGEIAWNKEVADKNKNVYGLAFVRIKPEDIDAVKKVVDAFS